MGKPLAGKARIVPGEAADEAIKSLGLSEKAAKIFAGQVRATAGSADMLRSQIETILEQIPKGGE